MKGQEKIEKDSQCIISVPFSSIPQYSRYSTQTSTVRLIQAKKAQKNERSSFSVYIFSTRKR